MISRYRQYVALAEICRRLPRTRPPVLSVRADLNWITAPGIEVSEMWPGRSAGPVRLDRSWDYCEDPLPVVLYRPASLPVGAVLGAALG
jgi:hypothetical protein